MGALIPEMITIHKSCSLLLVEWDLRHLSIDDHVPDSTYHENPRGGRDISEAFSPYILILKKKKKINCEGAFFLPKHSVAMYMRK